jgi:hypothetical protein
MKAGLARGLLLTVPLLLASCGRAAINVPIQERVLGPDRTLSLCDFKLLGLQSNVGAVFGVVGSIYDWQKAQEDRPYAARLTGDFVKVYEQALSGAGSFPYTPTAKLVRPQAPGNVPVSMDVLAHANRLHACVSATSTVGVLIGFNKKVQVTTQWELTGQSGWKIKIETHAKSKKGQGTFPDTADPKLGPVFLDLAEENADQFLAELAKQGMLPASGGSSPAGADTVFLVNGEVIRGAVFQEDATGRLRVRLADGTVRLLDAKEVSKVQRAALTVVVDARPAPAGPAATGAGMPPTPAAPSASVALTPNTPVPTIAASASTASAPATSVVSTAAPTAIDPFSSPPQGAPSPAPTQNQAPGAGPSLVQLTRGTIGSVDANVGAVMIHGETFLVTNDTFYMGKNATVLSTKRRATLADFHPNDQVFFLFKTEGGKKILTDVIVDLGARK